MELRLQPVYLTQMTHHPLILPSLVSITLIELRNGITPKNPVADTKNFQTHTRYNQSSCRIPDERLEIDWRALPDGELWRACWSSGHFKQTTLSRRL